MVNNDSRDSTTTVIHEEVHLPVSKSRRSSIFKPNIVVPNSDDDETVTKEYQKKVSEEYKNWRELYVDIKNKYFAIKDVNSKPTEPIPICSKDYQELLAKAENYVEKANDFFDQINCISTMNQNAVIFKQTTTFKLEQQENIMKENLKNMLYKS